MSATGSYYFEFWRIGENDIAILRAYVMDRRPPPDPFYEAVLCNDFVKAAKHADRNNLNNLQAYAAWLYNEAPEACWGSKEKYSAWLHGERRAG